MMTPQDKIEILNFLGTEQPFLFRGSKRFSTLVAGLKDCRTFTKRAINTGAYDPKIEYGHEGNWVAAIGYFTILDQIGSCYKPKYEPNPPGNTNSIKFAIEKFGFDLLDNNDRKLNSLIALRNAFTHDFNLLNIPRDPSKKNLQQHKFSVTADTENIWIVKLPQQLWDGDIEGKNFNKISDSTFVNLFGIGNLVESIYQRINNLIKNDAVDLQIPSLRLINKYTFVTSDYTTK